MRTVGICGSLRRDSYNRKLLLEAARLAPEDMPVEILELGSLPMVNEDLKEEGFPPEVRSLMEAVESADALLMVTPEYNTSVSPVLKNALDWLSLAENNRILSELPGAVLGASTGYLGTARMQPDLKKICANLNMHILNRPVFILPRAQGAFTPEGRLENPDLEKKLARLLMELKSWTEQLKK